MTKTTNSNTNCKRTQTIYTKKDISFSVALSYLEGLYANACNLLQDAEYRQAFNALKKRVLDMIDTPYDSNIIDTYVIIEQEDPLFSAKKFYFNLLILCFRFMRRHKT